MLLWTILWPLAAASIIGLPFGGGEDQRSVKSLFILHNDDTTVVAPAAIPVSTTGGITPIPTPVATLPSTVIGNAFSAGSRSATIGTSTTVALKTTQAQVDRITSKDQSEAGTQAPSKTSASNGAPESTNQLDIPPMSTHMLMRIVIPCGMILLIFAALMLANVKCPMPSRMVRRRNQPTLPQSTGVASSVRTREARRRTTADQISIEAPAPLYTPTDGDPLPPYASLVSLAVRNVAMIIGSLSAVPAANRMVPDPEIALQSRGLPPAYSPHRTLSLPTVDEGITDHADTSEDGGSESSFDLGEGAIAICAEPEQMEA